MSISEIYNVLEVHDRLITAGQPTEDQLRAAAAERIDTVINLAPDDSRSALPDEATLVGSLGMAYRHLPVAWDNPTEADFAAFERVMNDLSPDGRTLLHCAANFRVSAFYGLYAIKHLGWSVAQAEEFRAPIWDGSDYPIWESFIQEMQRGVEASNRLSSVGWLAIEGQRLLAVRTRGRDRFYLPGGKIEPGETNEDALVREVREELGIGLGEIRPAFTVHADAHGLPGTRLAMHCFHAIADGAPHPTGEIEQIAWLGPDDTSLAAPAVREVLARLTADHLI
jgi:8-oxo-dGTP diphosphatase